MNELTQYDIARKALSIAVTVDEVKNIIDKSAALKEYARRAKDQQMIIWANALQLDAEKKAGQMLIDMEMAKGTRGQLKGSDSSGGHSVVPPENDTLTLAEQDITKNQSSNIANNRNLPLFIVSY